MKSRRPRGRSPVIACRVRLPLYERIVASAKKSKRSMSEEMAYLIEFGFEMQDVLHAIRKAGHDDRHR